MPDFADIRWQLEQRKREVGIGALGVTAVISAAFVYANLIIWKLEYGKVLSGPFFSMLTRRDRTEDDF